MNPRKTEDPTPSPEPRSGQIPRRDLIRLGAIATVGAVAGGESALAGVSRFLGRVPLEKGRIEDLLERGARAVYRGGDLKFIGMPIGGICAGTVYLGGDGRLWLWDIFNEIKLGNVAKTATYKGETINPLGGANYVDPPEQTHPFAQGFSIRAGGKVRPLDATGWKDVSFTGEYPIGYVEYRDPDCPIAVSLEAFSPFVPLDADASGLPAVVLNYTLKNTGTETQSVDLGGWMENPVGLRTVRENEGIRENRTVDGYAWFGMSPPPLEEGREKRPAVLFEDWSAPGFGRWTASGTAFGKGAYGRREVPGIGFVAGGPGERIVKSFRIESESDNVGGDAMVGKLVGPEFTVSRRYIEFWIGGGNHPKTAYVGLIVDGKLVRSATGRQEDSLHLERFEVSEFEGKTARLEIVDDEKGFWGQIGVGQISFVDIPTVSLKDAPDFGEMALAVLNRPAEVLLVASADSADLLFGQTTTEQQTAAPVPARPKSGVRVALRLAPGESTTVSFAIAWRFPNLTISQLGKVGNHYASRFASVGEVIRHLREKGPELTRLTRLWHETWNDSSLPRWFLDRTIANASIMATMTCVRFANGRFYGWEGIGCCDGTCGHVWQYAHSVGRLFPSLERSVREMADYTPGVGFHEDTGLIDFRGEYGFGYAADAQTGYILRTYREHQTSPDAGFLKRVYPRMKKALDFLVRQDADADGILEGRQHNTLDVDLYGPSSWLSSLYLASLRAGEEMAKEMGDLETAKRWRTIFDRGSRRFDEVFWNGEYYIHRLNREEHPDGMRIGNGCECDQLMGQQWAHQIGLGRIVGEKRTKAALKALYRNNFLPDVSTIRKVDPRGRWYGMPGESGLLMCSFPQGDRKAILGEKPTWASMYFNEVWTGQEYQAASHMISEGLVEEGMRVVRAVHDRHHPGKRNPYNEVECSDHYARAMASHAPFLAACGFSYHGPKGHLGFAPKVRPEAFKGAFTAAEGWGSYEQRIEGGQMTAMVRLRHGKLRIRQLSLACPKHGQIQAFLGGNKLSFHETRDGDALVLRFDSEVRLGPNDALRVEVSA